MLCDVTDKVACKASPHNTHIRGEFLGKEAMTKRVAMETKDVAVVTALGVQVRE